MTISAADRGSLMRARLGFGDRPATGRRWPPGGRTLVGARGLPSSNLTTGSRFYEHLRSADVGRTGRKWARGPIPRNSVARGSKWGASAFSCHPFVPYAHHGMQRWAAVPPEPGDLI